MNGFEKLMQRYIMACLPPAFDTLQFAYRANSSTEDTIVTAVYTIISHLEQQGLLFVDFPLPPAARTEISSPTVYREGPHLSTALSLNTGPPHG